MKFKNLLPVLVVLLMSTAVLATSGYTEVYETDDIVEASIDTGASIMGGVAGEGPIIGSTMGSAIVIGIVTVLVGMVITLLAQIIGIIDVAKLTKRAR